MDALEFLKERSRMCKSYRTCVGCPLEGAKCAPGSSSMSAEEYEKIIATVEQWSKEHPRKTRQSVFLEQYPKASVDANGVLSVCPAIISPAYRINDEGGCADPVTPCDDCRREFWMQEVE